MTSSPQPLPSLPPSPGLDPAPALRRNDEDIAQAWHEDEDTITDARHPKPNAKRRSRKGKERAAESDEDEEDEDEPAAVAGYPPTKEEEEESRRVQENLRRWEIAERQRRKAARESASAAPTSTAGGLGNNATSLLADLFRRDSRKVPLGGVGTHQQLSMTDKDTDGDAVPLDDLETPSVDRFSPGPSTPEPVNPFDTPNPSRTSLNIPDHSAIMTESDTVPDELSTPVKDKQQHLDVPDRPTLQASSSFASPGQGQKRRSQPPPPKPLDLPAPRAPPPPADAPHASKPPEPVAPLSVDSSRNTSVDEERSREPAGPERMKEEDAPPVRWWHEWLCGCGEGPDRGGDHQAGRTNPME
ncbi:hypothetical protein OH76DRAFT_697218 [Lentinus brumalis]|uniref:Uncharacterized protein n=1 Tax=Lentinus brumalis TaxID=2498619 RepID=A0A371D6B5_9APHY|nr:hypothetical protein OH76DRAFT_697218 [Polyporus brumalis]